MSRDFVEFINSEDVKKYVRETGYQLSSQEAAFVVWQAKTRLWKSVSPPGKKSSKPCRTVPLWAMETSTLKRGRWNPPQCIASMIFCGSTSSGRKNYWMFSPGRGRHLHLGEAGRPLGGRRNQRLVLLRLPVRQL